MMINLHGLFFLGFFFLINLSCTAAAVVKYDYSVLALTWPRSYCLIMKDKGQPCKAINSVPPLFTVHDLWPNFLNDIKVDPKTTPNCSKDIFDPMALPQEVKRQANLGWPDLQYLTNKGTQAEAVLNGLFWVREWDKHGRCSNLEPRDYMELILRLYNIQLLPRINEATKELPNPKSVIDAKDFTNRIRDASGFKPRLMCKNITHPPYGQYLAEIRFNVTSVPPYQLQNMLLPTNCVSSLPVKFPQ